MSARRILRTAAVMAGLVPLALVVLPGRGGAQTSSTPSVTWNTYLGGTAADGGFGDDWPEGVITNREGETFVVGRTNAASFPGDLPFPLAPGGYDAFVTKYSVDGRVAWTRVFGGSQDDVGLRLAFVPYTEEHLYVVGTTASSSINNVTRTVGGLKGTTDAFLARLELDGKVSWFMYLDGAGRDEGRDVNVYVKDGNREVYVVGKRDDDVFVTQIDDLTASDPSTVWSTTFGSPGVDVAYAVTTNDFQRVFVGGSVSEPVSSPPLPTPLNSFGGGASDGFIAQLNPKSGAVNWFQYLGGNGLDDVRDLLYQPQAGGVTVIGNSLSTNFPPNLPRRGQEIFLVRVVGDNGDLQEKKLLVGEGGEYMEGHAAADVPGNIYFGGSTTSLNLALDAFDPKLDPGTFQNDGFIAMVDPELTGFVWASYVGGPASASEAVMGVSAVPTGLLTFVGHSNATDAGVLVVDSGYELLPKGGMDGFVFRMPVDPNARPPDGGTPGQDGGTTPGQDGGTTPGQDGGTSGPGDAGFDPGQTDDEKISPLGWGCGSAGGDASVGAVALMALALLLRRARS